MGRRRGRNEGTIYRRSNGRWAAQVSVGGRRVSHSASTRRECQEWIRDIRNQIDAGLTASGARATIQAFLTEWLESVRPSLRPKTWIQYSQIIRQHIIPYLGRIRLRELRSDQIQSLYNRHYERGASSSTVRIIHAVLHRALGDALRWGLIPRNPASVVAKPRPKRREMKVLSSDQTRRLLTAAAGDRLEALYHVAITTGLRQGEILGLMWRDLDIEAGQLYVQRQLQRIPGKGRILVEPKSASGRRLVVLGPATVRKLLDHSKRQRLERQFAGNRWQEHDLIFPSTVGTPMDQKYLHRHFKSLLRKAGLPDIRFHDLRHTAATLMLQEGVHPKVVQERLGHAQISVTLDTYSHVLPSMQVDAAMRLDELLAPIAVDLGEPYDHE